MDSVRFISRRDAMDQWLDMDGRGGGPDDTLRNYEIEEGLHEITGDEWIVTDWCPFDGRFCNIDDFVPYPHPPVRGHRPSDETGVPWRSWDSTMTARLR